MKEIVVLSGKGGTGKTSVAAALADLANAAPGGPRAVVVDADVDAANLELLVGGRRLEEHEFIGLDVAQVGADLCMGCGLCEPACRFDALHRSEVTGCYEVKPLACEGCAACLYECPVDAIRMVPRVVGAWYRSEARGGAPFFHARLLPARENSGKLVSAVKQAARAAAEGGGYPLVIVDGPPGVACPAIAASSGATLALIVAEPTVASLHDLERALEMAHHFRLKSVVCVNKSDVHPDGARAIQEHCRAAGVAVVASIPFEDAVPQAMAEGLPVTRCCPGSASAHALRTLWDTLEAALADGEAA